MSPKALLLVSIEASAFETCKQSVCTLCFFMRALALLRDTYLELASGIEHLSFLIFGLMGIKNQFRTHGLSDSWEDTQKLL